MDGAAGVGPIADNPIADNPIADNPIADNPIADNPIADNTASVDSPTSQSRAVPSLALDQTEARNEMARQLAVCFQCRQCVGACDVFPLAFDQIADAVDHDPGNCTPFQQDMVVDRCTFCAACTERCTHAGAPDAVDVMALMVRMQAVRLSVGQATRSRTVARWSAALPGGLGRAVLSRTCLSGDGCRARDGSVLGCCGAGELFSGNRAGFERLNAHLRTAIVDWPATGPHDAGSPDIASSPDICGLIVSDPRCLRLIRDTVA